MMRRFFFVLLLVAATNLAAQQDSVAIEGVSLQEFVVSGNRWQQLAGTLPVKASRITFEEGNASNPQTAADLLGLTGEVFIQKSQYGGGSPMIRGFSANRLLYSVDGVRMNNAIFRSGNLQNVISLDPFATESTEVLFGPGSVNYGSDAIGGVMLFNTLRPRLSNGKGVSFFGSSTVRTATASGERSAHLHVGAGWRKIALLTSCTFSDYGDLEQGLYGPDKYIMPYIVVPEYGPSGVNDRIMPNSDRRKQTPSSYSQRNFMQKVLYAPCDDWTFEYAFHYSKTSEYARYDRHQRMRGGKPRYAEWDYGPQKWVMNHLTAAHSDGGLLYDKMRLDLALQRFEESRISRNFGSTDRETQSEKVDAWSANLDFMKNVHASALSYGVEWVQNNVHSTGVRSNVATDERSAMPSRYPSARWYSYGAYANWQWHINNSVNIATGVRYNHYIIKSDFSTAGYTVPFAPEQRSEAGSLSGNVGVNWHIGEGWLLRANYARGFRVPNVDDMGKLFDSADGCVTVPNPALKPEYADNVEVGAARNIGNYDNGLHIDVTAYCTWLDDAIVRRDYTFNGSATMEYGGGECRVQALQTAARAYVFGVQGALQLRVMRNYYAKGNVNYQRGREELDDGTTSPSRHAAPLFGRAAVGWDNGMLCVEAYTAFQAECAAGDMPQEEKEKTEIYALDAAGNAYSPAWVTVNLRASYEFTEGLTVNTTLENIADRRYRPYSCGISAPGRNFTVSLIYGF